MPQEIFKTVPDQIEGSMGVKPSRGRWLSDIDDYQSNEFPNMSAKDFIEGVKAGTHHWPEHLDTLADESLSHAIMGELGLSPMEMNEILKNDNNARKYTDDYIHEYNRWKAWNSRPEWAKKNPYFNYEVYKDFFDDAGFLKPELDNETKYFNLYNNDPVNKALKELGNIDELNPVNAEKVRKLYEAIKNAPRFDKFNWDFDDEFAPDSWRRYYRRKWRNL